MSTSTRTRAQRAAITAATAAAVLVVPLAAPAAADRQTNVALLAYARLWTPTSTATYARICAEGRVHDGSPIVGEWVFQVIGPTSTFADPRAGATYAQTCHDLSTSGVPAGTTDASITYVGAPGDVLADCTATASWAPGVRLTWVGTCLAAPPPTNP